VAGHPVGFVNASYLGEVASCVILWRAPGRFVERLKERLGPFPETYRRAAIEKFLWEADFSLMCGKKGLAKGDNAYAAGSLYRAVISLAQVLFAFNGMVMLNEKGCLSRLTKEAKAYLPDRFEQESQRAFAVPPADGFAIAKRYLDEIRARVSAQ
jgi:hypothetical protein